MKKVPIEDDQCTYGNPVCDKEFLYIVKEKNDQQSILQMNLDKIYNADKVDVKEVTVSCKIFFKEYLICFLIILYF